MTELLERSITEKLSAATPYQRISLIEAMPLNSPERLQARKIYCDECGWRHPQGATCQCWNDDGP